MSPAEEGEICDCQCRCDQYPTWPQVGLFLGLLAFVTVFTLAVAGMFSADCR